MAASRPARAYRPRLSWDGAAFLLFAVTLLLVVYTFHDYGVTWDEDVHNNYGVLVLDYYLSWFKDVRALHWLNLYTYGAAFDMTAALINRVSPFGTYETRHLLNGLVGILGLVGAWKIGRLLGGERAGFLAALALVTIPNWYGQMYNNPKDIPFAVGTIWSLYYLCRIVPELPRPRLALALKLGFWIGVSLGVRVGGLLLFAYAGLAVGIFCLWRIAETRRLGPAVKDGLVACYRVVLPMVAIGYPVMLFFWPWAQQAPIDNPMSALSDFSYSVFPYKTLFAGSYFPATDLPWEYLPTHVVLALPELTLLLALAALPIGIWVAIRDRERTAAIQHIVLATSIIFPVAYAVAIRAVLFDGMRHFIFVLPPIAVVAALVADAGLKRLARSPVRPALFGALGVYGLGHLGIMIGLHPDQYVYYNGLVGGVEGASPLFKTDYWANSYAEAVQGLVTYLQTEYGAEFEDHEFKVAACGPPISADYFFPSNFIFTKDAAEADFFIAFTKDGCDKSLPGKRIYRVERLGALLSVVLDRREILAAAATRLHQKPNPSP
jgi:hypothetical protein